MSEPLKTITVIVDRRVLAELLDAAEYRALENYINEPGKHERVERIRAEVKSGERCELYVRDWPMPE
jgi:hypothetical protein